MSDKIKINITFGSTSLKKEYFEGTTIDEVLEDEALQTVLGFGDNVQARVDGDIVTEDYELQDADVVVIEVKANEKAA